MNKKIDNSPLVMVPSSDRKLLQEAHDEIASFHGALARNDGKNNSVCVKIRAALAAPVQAMAVPDGWKLVPVEPTEYMVDLGYNSEPNRVFDGKNYPEEYDGMSGCKQAAFRVKRCYDAMLAGAPAAPAAQGDADAALESAAKTIELFDDAVIDGGYMLDSNDCAAIIRALKSSVIAASKTEGGAA